MPHQLRFESTLRGTREEIFRAITSAEGIADEMRPYLLFSMPKGIRSLGDLDFRPGEVLYRTHIWLFGVLPIGRFDVTLLELSPNEGFVEQSPMAGMRLWRHERRLEDGASEGEVVLRDDLRFEPLFAASVTKRFVEALFRHRHQVLRRRFG